MTVAFSACIVACTTGAKVRSRQHSGIFAWNFHSRSPSSVPARVRERTKKHVNQRLHDRARRPKIGGEKTNSSGTTEKGDRCLSRSGEESTGPSRERVYSHEQTAGSRWSICSVCICVWSAVCQRKGCMYLL